MITTLLVIYHRQHFGDFLQSFLQRTAHHTLYEGIEFSLDSQFHLTTVVGDGQQLNPHIERYWRLFCLELNALGSLALNDAQSNLAYGLHRDAHAVGVEL